MIDTWAGLAPRLFLPLGMPVFYRSLVRGIAGAAKDVGHQSVTVLIGGITGEEELRKFRDDVVGSAQLQIGAVIQNMSALQASAAMLEQGCPLWIDLRELARSFHGFPEALSFADDVFDSYVADGYLCFNPRVELPDYLLEILRNLIRAAQAGPHHRVGIDCGSALAPAIVADLYDAGYRTFSVPSAQYASVRLMLAQRDPAMTSRARRTL
jgi:pyruvate,orthophosphate dikinase